MVSFSFDVVDTDGVEIEQGFRGVVQQQLN